MARAPRMSRLGFLVWLIAPVILVGVLWTQMDRSRGARDPRFIAHTPEAPAGTPAAPPPPSVASPPSPAPSPEARPELVEPESLAQGYIIVVTDEPKRANADAPIHLASSHNGWNPSDPSQRLTARSDGRWQIVMAKPKLDSRLAFKFTRGNWDTVEVSPELKDIENRSLPLVDVSKLGQGEPPIIEFVVPAWADQRPRGAEAMATSPYRAIKVAAGRIERLQVTGGGVPRTRDLLVWLPPGYDDPKHPERTFPVLYMQDGQNIFDTMPGVPGEWRADEAAARLIEEGLVEPMIIVGIPHAGDERASEYLPVPALDDTPPRGDAYVDFLVAEVLPRVERAFRVKRGREHTAIGGSSLGGLISLYAALKRPEVFGGALVESPSVRLGGREIWRDAFDGFTRGVLTVSLAAGGREMSDRADAPENARYVESVRALGDWLRDHKLAVHLDVRIVDEAAHTEGAWADRFPLGLRSLFPAAK